MGPIKYNQGVGTQFATSPAIPAKRFNTQRFNQIVRIAVQLAGTNFTDAASMMLKSNWDALIAATDETRIILSPPFSGSKVSPSKIIETSADSNDSYRGLPIYFGEGTTMFEGLFNDVDAAVLDAFFNTVAEFSMGNGIGTNALVAYLVNNDGHIFSTPTFGGLPCINLSGRSRGSDGLNTSDKTAFNFYMPPNWDSGDTLPTPTVPVGVGSVDLRAYAW
jgi:hypothetical protein